LAVFYIAHVLFDSSHSGYLLYQYDEDNKLLLCIALAIVKLSQYLQGYQIARMMKAALKEICLLEH